MQMYISHTNFRKKEVHFRLMAQDRSDLGVQMTKRWAKTNNRYFRSPTPEWMGAIWLEKKRKHMMRKLNLDLFSQPN
jgi:hypothetical protein